MNGADELKCGATARHIGATPPASAIVDFTGTGTFTVRPLQAGADHGVCPETHFRCPGGRLLFTGVREV